MGGTDWLSAVGAWAQGHLGVVVAAAGAALVVALLWLIGLSVGLSRAKRHYQSLSEGVEGKNLEALLNDHLGRLRETREAVRELHRGLELLQEHERGCLQRVGLVRYDAFDDVGGQVSFVIALLNDHHDGVMINSVFSRDGSSIYAKGIEGGRSAVPLAEEEEQAMRAALQGDSSVGPWGGSRNRDVVD